MRGITRELLAHAAGRQREGLADRSLLSEIDEHQIWHVTKAGLAPLLYRIANESSIPLPGRFHAVLQAADLCAQVRYGGLVDTAVEIIDICREAKVPITLLKGISTSDQWYPVAHERAMGDIDILVPQEAFACIESALMRRGYRPSDMDMGEDAYHGTPLLHKERQVWVEIHTALFPKSAALRQNHLFSPSHLAAQSVASTFHGRPVLRLADELQLVYIASYWIRDLTQNWIHPSFLSPLFDAVYLLKASGRTLDWDGLFEWLDNDMAAASLYVLLAYVCRSGLDDSAVRILPRLESRQDIVGSADLRVILAVLDTYLVRGKPLARPFAEQHATVILRTLGTLFTPGSHSAKLLRIPWNVAFPPLAPDRYKLRFQVERVARMFRRSDRGVFVE